MDDDNAGRVASVGSYIGGFVCAAGWYVYMAMALKAGQREYEWDCKADPKDLPAHVSAIAPCGLTSGAYVAPGILMSLGVVMLNVIRWTALGDDMSLGEDSSATKAKIWVVTCFVIMFCALGGGIWIIVVVRVPPSEGVGWRGWVAVGRARVCVDAWRCHTAATAAGPRAAHAHNYAAHSYGARPAAAGRAGAAGEKAVDVPRHRRPLAVHPPVRGRPHLPHRPAQRGSRHLSPVSSGARHLSAEAAGGCRLSLGRGRWLATQVSVISESYGGARTTEVLHLRPRCV